jgi:hypothetical protein
LSDGVRPHHKLALKTILGERERAPGSIRPWDEP